MENELLIGLGAVVLLLLIYVAVRLSLPKNDAGNDEKMLELKVQLERLTLDNRALQAENTKALHERLDTLTDKMGKNLTASATTTAKSFGEIQERLKVIDEAQTKMEKLGGDIIGLQDILSNKQERGKFGETQMNDLIRNTLPPNAYDLQATLSNGKRPDCLIKLPDPHGDIVIDSKFPLESYRALINASDVDKAGCRKAFSTDIMKHVKAISEKYLIPGETSDQAMMFLPSEAVYAELHANFPDIVEKSHKARVWIVSPTTLMATLHTARAVLKDAAIQEQAGFIQAEVGKMLEDVVRLDERVTKLATHFDLAERDIGDIQISTGKITKKATKITEIEMDEPATAIAGPDED